MIQEPTGPHQRARALGSAVLATQNTASWLHGGTLAPAQGWASGALGERRAMSPDQERSERK